MNKVYTRNHHIKYCHYLNKFTHYHDDLRFNKFERATKERFKNTSRSLIGRNEEQLHRQLRLWDERLRDLINYDGKMNPDNFWLYNQKCAVLEDIIYFLNHAIL